MLTNKEKEEKTLNGIPFSQISEITFKGTELLKMLDSVEHSTELAVNKKWKEKIEKILKISYQECNREIIWAKNNRKDTDSREMYIKGVEERMDELSLTHCAIFGITNSESKKELLGDEK